MESDSGDEVNPLTDLLNSPEFAQVVQLIRDQPDMLPQVLEQISTVNPELMNVIRENQASFLQLLNEEVTDEAAETDQAGYGRIPATEADELAISRIQGMGFPEQLVIEAYFACDKNEGLAVEYILSRMAEGNDGTD